MDQIDISKIQPGDRVKIRAAHRCGWVTGWRKVTGKDCSGRVLVTASGWKNFVLRDHEILEVKYWT